MILLAEFPKVLKPGRVSAFLQNIHILGETFLNVLSNKESDTPINFFPEKLSKHHRYFLFYYMEYQFLNKLPTSTTIKINICLFVALYITTNMHNLKPPHPMQYIYIFPNLCAEGPNIKP